MELIPLKDGVFQLEEGHGKWNADLCEEMIIAFAMLDPDRFEDDQEVFLPSSLEDYRLEKWVVSHEGWYVNPIMVRVEELAPVIYNFLPHMLVGQKVMLLDNTEDHERKTYIVKLISVHNEARMKLSPREKVLLDAARMVQPQKETGETGWAKVAAIRARGDFQNLVEKLEVDIPVAVQGAEASHICETTSSCMISSTSVSVAPVMQRLETAMLGAEAKEQSDLESNIPTVVNTTPKRPASRINTGLATSSDEYQESEGNQYSLGRSK